MTSTEMAEFFVLGLGLKLLLKVTPSNCCSFYLFTSNENVSKLSKRRDWMNHLTVASSRVKKKKKAVALPRSSHEKKATFFPSTNSSIKFNRASVILGLKYNYVRGWLDLALALNYVVLRYFHEIFKNQIYSKAREAILCCIML